MPPAAIPRPCEWWLRCVMPLVPAAGRADWLREWRAELAWAASRGAAGGRLRPLALLGRSSGALLHAAWLRYDRWRPDIMIDDLRQALRALAARPGFAAMAVLVLGVGIGANTAVFSAVHAVLLRPLPFADGVVRVFHVVQGPRALSEASVPDFADWRAASRTVTSMAAYTTTALALTGLGDAEQIPVATVTGAFFEALGVRAALGRALTPDDDAAGGPLVAVLSDGLWARRFGRDPGVVGRRVVLDGQHYEVVGVLPAGAAFPMATELWTPLRFTEEQLRTQRGGHYLDVIGRLAPPADVATAAAELDAIGQRLAVAYPSTNRATAATVVAFREALVGDVRPALLALLAGVGLVLLIACVNVANLLFTRALGRSRELAVRTALGADRARLVRGLFLESVVIAAGGAAGGALLAFWGSAAVVALQPTTGIPLLDTARVDGAVLLFCAGLGIGVAVLAGILPGLQATRRVDVTRALHVESRGATWDRGRARLRGALIVGQTALAVVVLVGAALLVRSLSHLLSVDLGFDRRQVLTYAVSLPEGSYPTPAARAAAVDALVTRLRALPDVRAAAAVFGLPLTDFGYAITTRAIDGTVLSDEEQDRRLLHVRVVTPDYFRVLGIPVRTGRPFTAADGRGGPPVAVLSESAVRVLWPDGRDPLGRDVEMGTRLGQGGDRRAGGAVIGVVGDVHHGGPAGRQLPTIYLAHAQWPTGFFSVAIKSAGDPSALVRSARAALEALDPDVPMFRVRTMAQLADAAVATAELYAGLFGAFGVTAVVLVALGLYGVLAHGVAQRRRELAVRLALGASRRRLLADVVTQGIGLAAVGIAIGLAAASLASRGLQRLVVGITPTDPSSYVGVAAGLLAVALLATWWPAWRASRVDPLHALRAD